MNRQDPLQNNSSVPNDEANATNSNPENNSTNKPVVWLDNQDLMQKLHVSPRTLQNWRSKGILPYYQIEHKIFYKEEDVNEMIINRKGKVEKKKR